MTITEFIKKTNLINDFNYFKQQVDIYINEMTKGLSDEESSLKMIPTYIQDKEIESVICDEIGIRLVNNDPKNMERGRHEQYFIEDKELYNIISLF